MNIAPSSEEGHRIFDTLDFGAVLKQLWGGRWWIAGSTLIGAILAVALAFQMTPIYRATVVMIPSDTGRGVMSVSGGAGGAVGSLAALAGIDISAPDAATKEALVVLRSRQFADSFIRDNGLLQTFFEDLWDPVTKNWKVPKDKQPTPSQAFSYFDRSVRSVLENREAGVVTLQINWRDRVVAAEWANELIKRLNFEMRRRAISDAEASLQFLKNELDATPLLDTRAAINRLIEAQINRRMLANVSSEFAFRVVDPAVVPDEGDVIRPRKVIMTMVGAFLGFFAAVTAVALFRRR